MAFSYDPDDLADPVNWVRLRIGDTTETDPVYLLEDAEITQVYTDEGEHLLHTAEKCCLRLLARISRDTNTDGAGLRTERQARVTQTQDVLKEIRNELVNKGAPIFTGNSVAHFEAVRDDDDARTMLTVLRRDRGC